MALMSASLQREGANDPLRTRRLTSFEDDQLPLETRLAYYHASGCPSKEGAKRMQNNLPRRWEYDWNRVNN
jgi:hypothetical protein